MLLWSLAGGLAALTVVLRSPNSGVPLDATVGPTLLLPPLAAAVVARLESITLAFVAGVGLGVLDQLVQWNFSDRREITYVAFLLVIVAALLLQRPSASRARLADDSSWTATGVTTQLPRAFARLPEVRVARVLLGGLVVAVAVYIPWQGGVAQVNYATVTLIFALGALSLVVLTGWGGVVSLGQVALMGVGGLTAANLIADRNTDVFLVLAASAIAGGLIALLIGLPGLRVVGQYLAVTTLAFAVVMEQYVVKPSLHPSLLPGRFERPELWGRVELTERVMYGVVLVFLGITAVIIANLRRARAGRVIAAVRDNGRRAAAVGVSGVEARLAGFVFAGMFAGVAGALHAVTLRNVGEQSYPSAMSMLLFSMAIIGGASSIGGTIAGVVLVRWLGYLFPRYQLLLTGVGLLLILMIVPGGLAQAFQHSRDRFAAACARRRGVRLVDDFGDVDEVDDVPERATTDLPQPVSMEAHRDGALLRCDGIESSYGSFQVLFGIDMAVADGEMVALLGTNGAGKSTLLRTASGLLPAQNGKVTFDGHDITTMPAERIAHLGLSLMPGGKGVFPTLTVAENMRLAGWMHRRDRPAAAQAEARTLGLFPILSDRWHQLAGDLSGGEQQQLSLAMAFVTGPKLLFIDELSLGLAPAITNQLIDDVHRIHRAGTTVVVVEQSVEVALQVCEHALFLEQGQVRFRGPTQGLLDRPDVLRAVFLGDAATAPAFDHARDERCRWRAAPRVSWIDEAFRWTAGGRQRRPDDPRRDDRRADRPQRRRQDDSLRSDLWVPHRRRWPGRARRSRHHRSASSPAGNRFAGTVVPGRSPVRLADGRRDTRRGPRNPPRQPRSAGRGGEDPGVHGERAGRECSRRRAGRDARPRPLARPADRRPVHGHETRRRARVSRRPGSRRGAARRTDRRRRPARDRGVGSPPAPDAVGHRVLDRRDRAQHDPARRAVRRARGTRPGGGDRQRQTR